MSNIDYLESIKQLLKNELENKEVINFSHHKNIDGSTYISITRADNSLITISVIVPKPTLSTEERDLLILKTFDKNPTFSAYKIGIVTGCNPSTTKDILKRYGRIKGKNK